MFTITMRELICPIEHCGLRVKVIVSVKNGKGYFTDEVYCQKHGEAARDRAKASWAADGVAFKDLS